MALAIREGGHESVSAAGRQPTGAADNELDSDSRRRFAVSPPTVYRDWAITAPPAVEE
jgi:hypothetical protein